MMRKVICRGCVAAIRSIVASLCGSSKQHQALRFPISSAIYHQSWSTIVLWRAHFVRLFGIFTQDTDQLNWMHWDRKSAAISSLEVSQPISVLVLLTPRSARQSIPSSQLDKQSIDSCQKCNASSQESSPSRPHGPNPSTAAEQQRVRCLPIHQQHEERRRTFCGDRSTY